MNAIAICLNNQSEEIVTLSEVTIQVIEQARKDGVTDLYLETAVASFHNLVNLDACVTLKEHLTEVFFNVDGMEYLVILDI